MQVAPQSFKNNFSCQPPNASTSLSLLRGLRLGLHTVVRGKHVTFKSTAALRAMILTVVSLTARATPWIEKSDVAIPMRDGVVLRAEVRYPDGNGPFPVLVYRTPYGKNDALKEYSTFQHALERGYAIVVQDVRGRFASDVEFIPYQNEGRDGYDTIEWA